jgi:hypothetical protein
MIARPLGITQSCSRRLRSGRRNAIAPATFGLCRIGRCYRIAKRYRGSFDCGLLSFFIEPDKRFGGPTLARRCIYCGESPQWRNLKRLLDNQFCNSSHREAYNERLRKIVSDLNQNRAANLSPPGKLAEPRLAGDPVPIGPRTLAAASSHALAASVMFIPEISITQPQCDSVGTEPPSLAAFIGPAAVIAPKGASPETRVSTSFMPVHPQGLMLPRLNGKCIPRLGIAALLLNPVQPASGDLVPHSHTTALPASVENHAPIRRWRLKIVLRAQAGRI